MTNKDTPLRQRSAGRFVVMGGFALLLIAVFASVFSMLIWSPAAEPTAVAAYAVVSDQSRQVQTDQPGQSENLEREPGPIDPVSIDPRPDEPRAMVNDLLDQHHLETHR